jgi:hypothetical protein
LAPRPGSGVKGQGSSPVAYRRRLRSAVAGLMRVRYGGWRCWFRAEGKWPGRSGVGVSRRRTMSVLVLGLVPQAPGVRCGGTGACPVRRVVVLGLVLKVNGQVTVVWVCVGVGWCRFWCLVLYRRHLKSATAGLVRLRYGDHRGRFAPPGPVRTPRAAGPEGCGPRATGHGRRFPVGLGEWRWSGPALALGRG